MSKKKSKINGDRFLAIIATFVGVITLIIFIYQTGIIHRQSRLSVTPRLITGTQLSENDSVIKFSFTVENKGIGPAIINNAVITNKGKNYPLDFEDYFIEVHPSLFKYGSLTKTSSLTVGSTLSPNEKKILFTFTFLKENITAIQKLLNLSDEDEFPFRVIIQYASIYEEEWKIDTDISGHPEKLN